MTQEMAYSNNTTVIPVTISNVTIYCGYEIVQMTESGSKITEVSLF
jgi:hypothetical protein